MTVKNVGDPACRCEKPEAGKTDLHDAPSHSAAAVPEVQIKSGKPSLFKAMFLGYCNIFLVTMVYKLANDILTFIAPKIME